MQEEKWAREKEYVRERLETSGGDRYSKYGHKFRSRYTHSLRVLKWVHRLAEEYPEADMEVLELAAIFHDIGYESSDNEFHAARGAEIFRQYAKDTGMNPVLAEKVEAAIAIHYQKTLLTDPNLPIEQILLMEADMMDEEGAMRIAWDCMAEGMKNPESFQAAYHHTMEFWKEGNPMVTPAAKRFWQEKEELMKEYLRQLNRDLEEA